MAGCSAEDGQKVVVKRVLTKRVHAERRKACDLRILICLYQNARPSQPDPLTPGHLPFLRRKLVLSSTHNS